MYHKCLQWEYPFDDISKVAETKPEFNLQKAKLILLLGHAQVQRICHGLPTKKICNYLCGCGFHNLSMPSKINIHGFQCSQQIFISIAHPFSRQRFILLILSFVMHRVHICCKIHKIICRLHGLSYRN